MEILTFIIASCTWASTEKRYFCAFGHENGKIYLDYKTLFHRILLYIDV